MMHYGIKKATVQDRILILGIHDDTDMFISYVFLSIKAKYIRSTAAGIKFNLCRKKKHQRNQPQKILVFFN